MRQFRRREEALAAARS